MQVGVNEAARLLGVGPSTVSRQVARFAAAGALVRAAGGTFDFDTFKQLRDGTLNPLMARNVDERPFVPHAADEPAPAPSAPSAAPRMDLLRQAHAAEKGFNARLKQLELLRETGRVTDVAGVEKAAIAAARLLVESLETRRRALADEFAGMSSPDDIEARLADADRALLAQFRAAVDAMAGAAKQTADLADVA